MGDKIFLAKMGGKIRTIRKEKKLTLDTLAALCDFEKANLSRIESGKTNTTVLTLFTLSKAMNVDVRQFFED